MPTDVQHSSNCSCIWVTRIKFSDENNLRPQNVRYLMFEVQKFTRYFLCLETVPAAVFYRIFRCPTNEGKGCWSFKVAAHLIHRPVRIAAIKIMGRAFEWFPVFWLTTSFIFGPQIGSAYLRLSLLWLLSEISKNTKFLLGSREKGYFLLKLY